MQYSIQGLNCEDAARKDLLMDIGTEELSHLEIVGTLARMHLKPMKSVREDAEADPLIAIAGGGGVNLFNSMGNPWTADYLKITGELDVDLRSNIAAEARAKIVYERLIDFCRDPGTKDALQFLMTREITHMKAFALALESMGKPPLMVGRIAPTPRLVNQYFNESTGEGQHGEVDARGPWNEGDNWEMVEAKAFMGLEGDGAAPESNGVAAVTSDTKDADALREMLIEDLRYLLSAEQQLVKALPKMADAANTQQLKDLLAFHLKETNVQVDRLTEALKALGGSTGAKTSKGMRGLIEEGEEIVKKGEQNPDTFADLALIGVAQRVEHYEIAAYTAARNMAIQLHEHEIAQLLTLSLGEEMKSDYLLNQVSQPLTSLAGMPPAVR
jgi:Mn-containing catalase